MDIYVNRSRGLCAVCVKIKIHMAFSFLVGIRDGDLLKSPLSDAFIVRSAKSPLDELLLLDIKF